MVLAVNHVPGFSYDANGDVTNDAANTYAYNVEGRPMTVNGYGQVFDAFDRLVESQNAGGYTSIVYSPDGYKLALMNGSSVVKYMAPLAAGMQAVYTANTPAGVAYWRHADWLGSSRLATTVGQTVYYDGAYAPFGENYAETGTTDRDFTGQTQDTTPGLYDFLFRQQSSSQGRWLVPDPAGLAAVDLTNPQTWNRYAYVMNNPLSYIDPLGLYLCIINGVETDRGCPGTSGAPGAGGGGGGLPVYVSGTCWTLNPGPDGGVAGSYYTGSACTVFAGFWSPSGGSTGAGGGGGKPGIINQILGLRAPGQTWSQCMAANANTYSIGGATELAVNVATGTNSNISQTTSIVTGNGITGLIFEGPGTGDFLSAAGYGAGSSLTYGRRTSSVMSLNLAGNGGLPQALGSTGAQGFFKTAGKWLNLGLDEATKFAVDAGLAGAEAINCAIPNGG
jgi:RHS repeat-associated protein